MKQVTRFSVLGFGIAVVLFAVLTGTSSKTEATPQDSCGSVVYLPPGSMVTPKGEGLQVTYADSTTTIFDCECTSGAGSCFPATNGEVMWCMMEDDCENCRAVPPMLAKE